MISLSKYDSTDNREKYRNIARDAFSLASHKYGYIDYHHAHVAMSRIFDLLEQADSFIEEANYREALYMVMAVAPECIEAIQNMDDSNGECGNAINEAFRATSNILEIASDEPLKNEIFEWLMNEANNPDYDDYGCADELEPLIIEAANTPEKCRLAHEFIDSQLAETAKKDGWSKEYGTKKYLLFKSELFKKSGEIEKAKKIIHDNIRISDFREIIVNEKIAEGNYEDAIQLIKKGVQIAIEDNYAGTKNKWKEKLLEIYQKQKDIKNIRKYASELFFGGHYDMRFYKILRKNYDKKEWLVEKENIINMILKKNGNRSFYGSVFSLPVATIYVEEKMWDRLFNLVKKKPNINSLLNYSKYLKDSYSSELVALYKPAIEDFADRNMGRKNYHQLVHYLKKMADLSEGKEAAKTLKNKLLEKHKNRPAMKDEFRKLPF